MDATETTLKKEIHLSGVFAIAAGAMISSGLFILPGLAFEMVGPSMIAAYALAGLLNLPTLLAQAELSTAIPRSAGGYFVVERSLGPLAGTIAGFINWSWISLKAAFALIGVGTLAVTVLPLEGVWIIKLTAVAAVVGFMVLNLVSVKEAGRLQAALVIGLIGILVLYTGMSLPHLEVLRYEPFLTGNPRQFLAVTGMVFISFGGLTKVFEVSEEVAKPVRNLPLGMFLAFLIVNLLYVAVAFVTVGVLEPDVLGGSLRPIAQGAEVSMGAAGFFLLAFAALLAYATTGNAGILSASRSPMAMSRDGLAPRRLSHLHGRWHTPAAAILLTGGLMIFVIVFLSIEELAKTASALLLISLSLINLCVIIMRKSGIEAYRPAFHMPLVPWLPLATILIYGVLVAGMGLLPLLVAAGFITAAVLWYFFYGRRNVSHVAAVSNMVKLILSRHLQRLGLEDELVHIGLERDEVELDRFDKLTRRADILDIREPITMEELFDRIAKVAGPRLGLPAERVAALLMERERESSTMIQPGLAIPHIVIEGANVFELVLVRCREGAIFHEGQRPVQMVFALIGSPDERNFHLQALMSIAYVVQEKDFEARWLKAANPEQLRDIVLLSKRPR